MHKFYSILFCFTLALSGQAIAGGNHGHGSGHDHGEHGDHGKKHQGHNKRGGHFPGHLQRMVKKLDLSAEQKTKLKQVFKNTRVEMKKLRDQMHEKRKAMYQALHADDASESATVALANELGELKKAKMVLYVKTHFQISAQLTDKQREKLRAMHKRHHSRHKH